MIGALKSLFEIPAKETEASREHRLHLAAAALLIETARADFTQGVEEDKALEQLLNDTNWRALDYLVVDLPPGTGDTQLTLAQKIPVSGAVIVTTPQDIALLDARKGLKMFEKVQVPVLGVIENMSTHICTNCGHEEHIFGSGGGMSLSEQYDVDFLGSLPLDITIRRDSDNGQPTVAANPDGPIADMFRQIARRVAAKLSLKDREYSQAFPSIVIQNN